MTVVSYRLYCDSCSEEAVVRKSDEKTSEWTVNSFPANSGVCPSCQKKSGSDVQESDSVEDFTEIEGIGRTVDSRLKERNIETAEDVERAADRYLLSIDGVGEKTVERIKENS